MTRTVKALILVLAGLSAASSAEAQIHVGPQLSVGTDSGLGLGGRLVFPLRVGVLGMDGAADGNYFFGGGSAIDSWIDANLNVRIPIPLARDFTTRIGAGLNVTIISVEQAAAPTTETDSEFGFNFLASAGLPEGRLAPFAELRLVVGGAEQFVLTGGFTVGSSR